MACSFSQERMWRSSRTPDGSVGYTMASQMRIHGPLDVDALRAAIQHAVNGQELLCATFVEREGRPFQLIGAPPEIEMPVIELENLGDPDPEIKRILRRRALEPLDLERGPLLRLWLARVGAEDHRLLRLNHHIVTDWVSWRIFFTDVARAYEANRRGERPPEAVGGPQYPDFAAWERERLRPDGPVYRDQLEWWRRAIGPECPTVRLPFSRPAPAPDATAADGLIHWEIEPEETAALDEMAARAGTTSFVIRLAAFSAHLGLSTGQEQIALGTYAMNRPAGDAQAMFGFFSNPIMLMLRFDPKLSFRRWLARAQEVVTEAKAHSEIPYDRLSEELHRDGAPPPEMSAMFHRRGPWPLLEPAGIELEEPRYLRLGMPWGFSFGIDANRDRERWGARFDPRIHEPEAVRDFVDGYLGLMRRVMAKPRRRLRRLI
ncbi:MAG TPA: condensation domain-containing protein [Solirubrobacterales bacterium]